MAKEKKEEIKNFQNRLVSSNRKARHDYDLFNTFEAGIMLMGSEIKSVRNNRVNLSDGFIQERDGELWLMNTHIAPYDEASIFGHSDPLRPRKLLLHRKEINQIINKIREPSYTAVPLKIYLERGLAKVEIALARGKKLYDKRADIAKRETERQIRRDYKDG